MRLRVLLTSGLAASLATTFLLAACGSDDSSSTTPPATNDASTNDAATTDTGSTSDANGSNDGGLPEGSVAPQGTQIVTTANQFHLNGVTSDDVVIYSDTTAKAAFAVPLAGGTPTQIDAIDAQDAVFVQGNVAFVIPAVNQSSFTGKLTAWTKAGGAHTLATSAIAFDAFTKVSADGQHVLFIDDIDANDNGGNVYISAPDGTGKTKLVSNVAISNTCFPHVGFAGAYAVVSYCIAPPVVDGGAGDAGSSDAGADGGDASVPAQVAFISSFDVSTGAMKLDANVQPGSRFVTDDATLRILANEPLGGLIVYSADLSANATPIDADGVAGVFAPDGQSVIYTTKAKALKRSPVATPAPVTLQATAAQILALSGDGAQILTNHATDTQTGNYDIYLQSATAAGTSTALASATTANVFGDAFSADSKNVLFYTDIDDNGAGTVNVVPVTGGTPVAIGQTGWVDYAVSASRFVYSDNDTTQISADLEYVDLAAGTTPTKLVSQIDQDFYLTKAKDKIVYGWSDTVGPQYGIWVMPVPQ